MIFISSFLVTCLFAASSGLVINRDRRSTTVEEFIRFVNEDGRTCATETVTVTDSEARFDVNGQMAYVFDYKQELLIFKELSGKDRPCRVTKFNTKIVPPPDKIKESLSDSKFKLPTLRHKIRLQRSRDQTRPSLLPLSEDLCSDATVIVLEKRPRRTYRVFSSYRRRPRIRPKREIGWGEVIVIFIVVVLVL